MFATMFGGGPEEKRRDPQDGQWRTYRELQRACADRYTPEEIRVYWETQCTKEEDMEGDRVMHNVVSDPFMTLSASGRQQLGDRMPQGGGGDPFADGSASPARGDDRYATRPSRGSGGFPGGSRGPGRAAYGDGGRNSYSSDGSYAGGQGPSYPPRGSYGSQGGAEQLFPGRPDSMSSEDRKLRARQRRDHFQEEVLKVRRHWTEVATRLLGEGDTDRKKSTRNILVLAPWLVFMWVLLLWLLLRHYSSDTCWVLTIMMGLASAALIAMAFITPGKSFGPAPYLVLGSLSLLAVISGTAAGAMGWHMHWRQYWWLQTGVRSDNVTAATPAAGMVDAAMISFWDGEAGRTRAGTYVDHLKGAGYKDKHYYCAAPILSPATAEATTVRVNFWAVGIDCCQRSSAFHCDDSRVAEGGHGVVMLDEGFPCPDCNGEYFRSAIQKAEALHGLVSVPGALMVRWVRNPRATEMGMLWKALLFIVLCGLLSLLLFALLGTTAWYYGLGRLPLSTILFPGSAENEARQKLLA